MSFSINRKFSAQSFGFYTIDFHATEPWLLTGLQDGQVIIYNVDSGLVIRTLKIADCSIECVKFVERMNWFIVGVRTGSVYVFNATTYEKVIEFKAHEKFMWCLAVHPTESIILTGSDDWSIKAWNWDKQWRNFQTYEGHWHPIKSIAFNPKDPSTFVAASLGGNIKMWSITSPREQSSINVHFDGARYVDFHPSADKPYIIATGEKDTTVQVMDYTSKDCIKSFSVDPWGATFAVFHPTLPIIITGGKAEKNVKVWNSESYTVQQTLDYGLSTPRCITFRKGTNEIAIGCQTGCFTFDLTPST